MQPVPRRSAAQLPAIVAALAATSAFGTACLDVAEAGSNSCLNIADAPSGASLLQHHRSRHLASTPAEKDPGQIFLDIQDNACQIGSSCTAGGIPRSRGACVHARRDLSMLWSSARPKECWDICNVEHLPEDFSTGDAQFDTKLAQAVKHVRAGAYPQMRCPALSTLNSEISQAPAKTDEAPAPADVSEGGCCFSFAYGAEMEPCCFTAERVKTRDLCSNPADLVGGKTGFTSGSCPTSALEADTMIKDAEAPAGGQLVEAIDIMMVMDGIRDAEKAAEKARLLTTAAKMESEALRNAGAEGDMAVAEVMKLAAASEADAAEKAKKVSEDLKQLSEDRFAKATAERSTAEVDLVPGETPTKADDAPLEAEVVPSGSDDIAMNSSEATLALKKDQELKRTAESKAVAEQTSEAKEEVEHFEEAIKESKALNVTANITDSLMVGAAASMKEVKESEEAEVVAEQALKAAKAQTAEAQAAVDAEKAQLGEDSSAQDAKDEPAPIGEKVQTAECRWIPAPKCVREFEYAGKMYIGCADVDSGTPWCSLTVKYAGNYNSCTSTCDAPASNGTSGDAIELGSTNSPEDSAGSNRTIIQAGSQRDFNGWGKGAMENLTVAEGTQP